MKPSSPKCTVQVLQTSLLCGFAGLRVCRQKGHRKQPLTCCRVRQDEYVTYSVHKTLVEEGSQHERRERESSSAIFFFFFKAKMTTPIAKVGSQFRPPCPCPLPFQFVFLFSWYATYVTRNKKKVETAQLGKSNFKKKKNSGGAEWEDGSRDEPPPQGWAGRAY